MRRCADCPDKTKTVCRHAFADLWHGKSHGAQGCAYPLDEVADSWYAAGWRPKTPKMPRRQAAPSMPRRPFLNPFQETLV